MAAKNSNRALSSQSDIETPSDMLSDEMDIPSRKHEILGVVSGLVALVMTLAVFSYDGVDDTGAPIVGGNWIGLAGTWAAYLVFRLMGASVYLLNLCMWVFSGCLFTGHAQRITVKGIIGAGTIVLLAAIALHTMLFPESVAGGHNAGGLVGTSLGSLFISLFSSTGTYIIAFGGIIVTLLVITDISLFLLLRAAALVLKDMLDNLLGFLFRIGRACTDSLPEDTGTSDLDIADSHSASFEGASSNGSPDATTDSRPEKNNESSVAPVIVTNTQRSAKKAKDAKMPEISQTIQGDFQCPSLALLEPPPESTLRIDKAYLEQCAIKLASVMTDFGVSGDVREIHPGPVVTMYEFQPKSGTKLSKIGSLSNEVAMALEVKRVRIVAPIPGKNAVGFELPNKKREMVRLREIFEDPGFAHSKAKLPMALGKDISGTPYCVDLAKMPHLLMAGTTGSGKSVSVNTMLLSFLFRHTPDELRLLLIDPKMIEFQPYNHIPHLLLPVVTDMSQACLALQWGVDEMERRYQLFSELGAKNLESYNNKVVKIRTEADATQRTPLPEQTTITKTGAEVTFGEEQRRIPDKKLPEKLPLIVICIDELADLMMVAAKDVENSIARLAQKARASGIHLIVATQRPSTDVVTGLIKANFPARLSCQVSSGIDSRTILGSNGAEQLLGNGDMLIVPPGTSELHRLQGAFVSEEEVVAVVDFLKHQGLPQYDDDILKPRENDGNTDIDDDEKDDMYDQAVAIIADAQMCSISMLQRKLRIGYNRSARIVEIMEKEGVVSPANGQNKREVLISPLDP